MEKGFRIPEHRTPPYSAGCQGCVAKKTVKTLSFKIFKTLTESNDEIFARNSRKASFFVWPKMEDDTFSEK